MKFKKFTALLLAALLVLSLAACGTKDNDKKADMSSNDSAMTDEPKNAEEALALGYVLHLAFSPPLLNPIFQQYKAMRAA